MTDGFQQLVAWQRSMDLVERVYRKSEHLPRDERFGLVQQMRRAAVSVPSNIAEGYARETTQEFVRFLRMARGSLAELQTQWLLCRRLGYLEEDAEFEEAMSVCIRPLQGLLKSMVRKAQANANPR